MTLIYAALHFDGGTVLHWAEGAGALLSGDVFQVVMDRRWVSFMYSYPNLIPEWPARIRRALELVSGCEFADIHGAFRGRSVRGDGNARLVGVGGAVAGDGGGRTRRVALRATFRGPSG